MSALYITPELYRYRLEWMTMNLTKMTTLVALSACAIAESSTAASANVIFTPESVAEIQVPDSIIQLENATKSGAWL